MTVNDTQMQSLSAFVGSIQDRLREYANTTLGLVGTLDDMRMTLGYNNVSSVDMGPFSWATEWTWTLDPGSASAGTNVNTNSFAIARDIAFSPDGTVMYVTGGTTDDVPGEDNTYVSGGTLPDGTGRPQDVFCYAIQVSDGTKLWATRIGTTADANKTYSRAYAIEISPDGSIVYCGGRAGNGFYTTVGAYRTAFGGDATITPLYGPQDSFVTALDATDGTMIASTLVPSAANAVDGDIARDIAVDSSGRVLAAITRGNVGGTATTGQRVFRINSGLTATDGEFDMGGIASSVGGNPVVRVSGGKVFVISYSDVAMTEIVQSPAGYQDAFGSGSHNRVYLARLNESTLALERYTYFDVGVSIGGETHYLDVLGNGDIVFCAGGAFSGATVPHAGVPNENTTLPGGETTGTILVIMDADLTEVKFASWYPGGTDGIAVDPVADRIAISGKLNGTAMTATDGTTGTASRESSIVQVLDNTRAVEFASYATVGTATTSNEEGRTVKFDADGTLYFGGTSNVVAPTGSGQFKAWVRKYKRFSPSTYDPLNEFTYHHFMEADRNTLTLSGSDIVSIVDLGGGGNYTAGIATVQTGGSMNGLNALIWANEASLLLPSQAVAGTFFFVFNADTDRTALPAAQQPIMTLIGSNLTQAGYAPRAQSASAFTSVWPSFDTGNPTLILLNGAPVTWGTRDNAWDAIVTGTPVVLAFKGALNTNPASALMDALGHAGVVGNATSSAFKGVIAHYSNTATLMTELQMKEKTEHLQWKYF